MNKQLIRPQKAITKLLIGISLIMSVLLTLTACTSPVGKEEPSADTDPAKVEFVREGLILFDLLYSQKSEFSKISGQVEKIEAACRTYFGTEISTQKIENYKKNDSPKILLADTNYEESKAAVEGIRYGGYTVQYVNGNIIINATSNEALTVAVNYFCNRVLKEYTEVGSSKYINVSTYTELGKQDGFEMQINSNRLEDYAVIYPTGDTEAGLAANALVHAIGAETGIALTAYSDSTDPTEKEILVGETNRDESVRHKNETDVYAGEYEYKLYGSKLSIVSFGDYGIYKASEGFIENFSAENITNITGDFKMKKEIALYEDECASFSEGTDVRIMTANILSEEWADSGYSNTSARAEILLMNLLEYKPTVIGLQEVSAQWSASLAKMLENSSYTVLFSKVPGSTSNYCPIIYDSTVVRVVDSDAYQLSIGGPSKARVVTWGVFEKISDGKRFSVVNTHLDWTRSPNDFESHAIQTPYAREQQVKEVAATIAEIKAEHGVDVFATGDWNTSKGGHPLSVFTELTGLAYSSDLAQDDRWGSGAIDHIFAEADAGILLAYTYKKNSLGASDHPFGIVDARL